MTRKGYAFVTDLNDTASFEYVEKDVDRGSRGVSAPPPAAT